MVNFYTTFLKNPALVQPPLKRLLEGPISKGKQQFLKRSNMHSLKPQKDGNSCNFYQEISYTQIKYSAFDRELILLH